MEQKYLIVGLGNPGKEYANTPHNVGFLFIDFLCSAWNISLTNKKKEESQNFTRKETLIHIIKPFLFMNLSGEVLCSYMKKQNFTNESLLVIHDEVEMPAGQWNWKEGGGHKGHNGLRNIIACGGNNFTRLRIGVDRPANKNSGLADYLLTPMKNDLREKIITIFPEIYSSLETKLFPIQ